MDQGVSPCSADEKVVADTTFDDHAEFSHEVIGDGVVGGSGTPDPVQAELVESECEQQLDGLGAESSTPYIGAKGEADLCTVLAGVLGIDGQASKSDHFTSGRQSRREGVLGSRLSASGLGDGGDGGLDLLAGPRLETEMPGGDGVTIDRQNGVDVFGIEIPEADAVAFHRDRVHEL